MSTFQGIEIGKTGLITSRRGLDVVGHNIANVANRAYSRQRVEITSLPSIDIGKLKVGQGALATTIRRIRDFYLDLRIYDVNALKNLWETKFNILREVEQIVGEPGTTATTSFATIKTRLEDFVNSLNDMANHPSQTAHRQEVLVKAKTLTQSIRQTYHHLYTLQQNLNDQIIDNVREINNILKEIADLNVRIAQDQAKGLSPNDLMDKRDALVKKLSSYLDVQVTDTERGYIVSSGGIHLVLQDHYETIEAVPTRNLYNSFVHLEVKGKNFLPEAGKLRALLDLRDRDIAYMIRLLNSLAANLISDINAIHKEAFGLNGKTGLPFFKEQFLAKAPWAMFDLNGDGIPDSTGIYMVIGKNKLDPNAVLGFSGTIDLGNVKINYYAEDRVKDVITRINASGADVVAYLDTKSRLVIKATLSKSSVRPDFVISHLEDSGRFLSDFAGILKGSGKVNAFDWHIPRDAEKLYNYVALYDVNPASWIDVSEAVAKDPNNIAAAYGKDLDGDGVADELTGKGDNRAALDMVKILSNANVVMLDKQVSSFSQHIDKSVAWLGALTQGVKMGMEREKTVLLALENMKESISGVDIDEEVANMIKYQHSYQAAAKFIATLNQMLDMLIRMV